MLRKIKIIIISFVLILIGLYGDCICFAAQPKEELKQIKKEINIHKKKLQETKKIEENVLEDLNRVSKQLQEIERKISSHKAKIKALQTKIAETEKSIKSYSYQLETKKTALLNKIKALQRLSNQTDPTFILLMEEDITKAFRIIRNSQTIINLDKKLIQQYKAELNNLIVQQTELKKLYASLKQEEEALKKAETDQREKKKEKEAILAKVRQNKALYERKIKELEENARRLTRLLQQTEKKEKRTQSSATVLPEGGFTQRKGTLIWPVKGSVVAHYGNQRDPVFNVPMFRSGIYIQAPPGTAVKASAEGKVVYANYFKGYENLVIISHGEGYYTVYGNLDSITVKEGAFVKAGQVLGTVSEKSHIDTTAVYFEIRYRGKPLNPEQWLRK